jgi:ferredoxin
MFNDFTKMIALMNTCHLFSEHAGMDGQQLRQVGPFQYALHWFYGVIEPPFLKIVDILITRKWINNTFIGRGFLKVIVWLSWYFPHGLIVTTEAAERMVDFVIDTEGPKGARIAVGPCVCQLGIGKWVEPCKKDMVVVYGADIYLHLKRGYELVDRDQAKAMLREFADAGLVHSIDFCFQSGKWVFVICSCDTEICVPARLYQKTGRFLYPGPEVVKYDANKCLGTEKCGQCIQKCLFSANQEQDGKATLNVEKCLGCGLCIKPCKGQARSMSVRTGYRRENVVSSKILLGQDHSA